MTAADLDVKLTEDFFSHVTQDPHLSVDLEKHWRNALARGRIEGAWVRLRGELPQWTSGVGLDQHFPSDQLWYVHLADLCRERFGSSLQRG
jgi:hypothetical protein